MTIKLSVGAAVVVAGLSTVAMGQQQGGKQKDFFPIMAWDMAPNDPAVLKEMHECGITVAGFAAVGTLPAVRAAGMKAIVSDPRCASYDWQHVDEAAARKNIESLTAEVKGDPTVFGYYLRDEPPASYFAGLATVAKLIKERHPGAWPYINLFPNYATPEQLGTKDYATYLGQFEATCHPPILSYDNYSLTEDGGLREEYFSNLEAVRASALKQHVPFWNIVLGNAHFDHPEPSAAGLRFEAYTSLAYGAKGLAYFTYFAPKHGNYRMAPIDQFGHKTATWGYMRDVNLQVLQLGPTLLHLTSTGVYHFGKLTAGEHGPAADSLVSGINSDQFMVGDFTDDRDGTRYVMVVNKSLTHSAPAAPQFRKAPKAVGRVNPYNGEVNSFDGENVWIAPGAGALLRITER